MQQKDVSELMMKTDGSAWFRSNRLDDAAKDKKKASDPDVGVCAHARENLDQYMPKMLFLKETTTQTSLMSDFVQLYHPDVCLNQNIHEFPEEEERHRT